MRWFDVGAHAEGIVAVGQFATGVFAFGQMATGVVAVGQLARGVVAVGQLAAGVFTLGMVAAGPGYSIGMLAVGLRSKGLLALSVVPETVVRQIQARVKYVRPARLLTGTEPEGWLAVRLVASAVGVTVSDGHDTLPVEFSDRSIAERAYAIASSATSVAEIHVKSEARGSSQWAGGYRAVGPTERVLVCDFVQPRVPPPWARASFWFGSIARLAFAAGLAAGFYAAVLDPLLEFFGSLRSFGP